MALFICLCEGTVPVLFKSLYPLYDSLHLNQAHYLLEILCCICNISYSFIRFLNFFLQVFANLFFCLLFYFSLQGLTATKV